MRQIKENMYLVSILFVSGVVLAACYPTGSPPHYQDNDHIEEKPPASVTALDRPDQSQEPELKDEKQFPNGTVVGKYSYLDNEGNPIQVKYYADEASYGVELKSIKVVDASDKRADMPTSTYSKDLDVLKSNGLPEKKSLESFNSIYPSLPKLKTSEPFEYLHKEASKINRYKADKSSPDFEVYYQNELKAPKTCGKEKVRVYFDKDRKIRNAIDSHFDADKYCEQF